MAEFIEYVYKESGASFSSHTAYLTTPILEMLSQDKNKTILDLGCGNGWLVDFLLAKGYNIYGTDVSPSGVAIGKQKHPDRFFVLDPDAKELPAEFRHLHFDTILSIEVIEHLYDPRSYFKLCKHILAQGKGQGELIVSTPYHGYLKNVVLALSGKMDAHFSVLWDGGHIKFWSEKTLKAIFEEFGFHFQAFRGCGRFPYLWKSMLLSATIK
jgi:2-polyprenyl-3-methyl-5-hydroxy-6-metoxy-1,4-benzoquinol methylase